MDTEQQQSEGVEAVENTTPTEATPSFTLPTEASTTVDALNSARKKHEDRAKRFGVNYVEPKLGVLNAPKRYMNPKKSGFVTGFSLNDESEKQKRELRAKKFGLELQAEAQSELQPQPADSDASPAADAPVEAIQDDSGGMDVDIREERKDVGADIPRRLDTIYLYGTDDMSTQDVFKYFNDYGPECVEWINDSSCNIIFRDVHTTMRALQGLSKPVDEFNLQVSSSGAITTAPSTSTSTAPISTDETAASAPAVTANNVSIQATPEQITLYGWRKGVSVKGVPMLLRYATVADVKSKEFKPSAYYKRMLAQVRAKHSEQKRQSQKKKHNNRNKRRGGGGGGGGDDENNDNNNNNNSNKSKRKHDDGDIEMLDPAEQEKRLRRRKRFFPEREETSEGTFIISSTTVPALLREGVSVFATTTTNTNTASEVTPATSETAGV